MVRHRNVRAILGIGFLVSAVAIGQTPVFGPAAPATAESFGPDTQELHIGAAAFQHLNNDSGYEIDWTTDGYLSYTDASFLGVFVAPLQLPNGAEIQNICTYFYDTAPAGAVTAYLEVVKLGYQDLQEPGVIVVWGPIGHDTDTGYDALCSASSYTFRNWLDMNGDGSPEPVVHRLRVDMTETGEGRLALGAVRVNWRRQVSPAPSTASFADVPTDHPLFQFIQALYASGITAGCGGDNFCPNAPLTRGQMAVFLSKALGLHWPY
jgi:S-layer homology domain